MPGRLKTFDCSTWKATVDDFTADLATEVGFAEELLWAARATLAKRDGSNRKVDPPKKKKRRAFSEGKRAYLRKKISKMHKAGVSDADIKRRLRISARELAKYADYEIAAGNYNSNKTQCSNGHEYDEANTYWHGPGNNHRACKQCSRDKQRKRDTPNLTK